MAPPTVDPFAAIANKPSQAVPANASDPFAAVATQQAAAPTPPAATPPSGLLDPHDENDLTSRAGNFIRGGVHALGQLITHPFDTLSQIPSLSANPPVPVYGAPKVAADAQAAYQGGIASQGADIRAQAADAAAHPAYAAGSIILPALAGEGVGRVIPRIARGGAEILSKTTPAETGKFIDTTSAANDAATTKAADVNSTATAKRAQQLQDHFARTQAAQSVNDAASALQSRKVALQRGVETLDPLHKMDLQNLEGTVRGEANRRYNELNGTLDPEMAPPTFLPDLLSDASEAMKGSNTETPIMKDMERRLNAQEPLTYRDLQGYRSEIGRELQKGTLPGDVYHAYKGMQDSITDAMSDIAKSRNLGDQFDQARSYYRQMSDTFDKPTSPVRRALNSTEPYNSDTGTGGVVQAFKGKDTSGIEALAKYDPDLAQRINATRGYAAEAAKIRNSTAAPKVAPTLAPKPTPVAADVTKVGPAEIQTAKADNMATRADKIRNTGHGLANTLAVLDSIRNIIHGNVGGLATDLAARGGLSVLQHATAAALENPRVVEFLSKPTPADLDQLSRLPASQRAAAAQSLQPLIEAARARGVPVAAPILAIAGANSLPPNHLLAPDATPTNPDLQIVGEKFPAYKKFLSNVVVTPGTSNDDRQVEFYPPWESDNPNPGKLTIQPFQKNGETLPNTIAGELLHYIGGVDPSTNKPVDPNYYALKQKVASARTPEQQAIDQRAYQEAKKDGETRPFEKWFDQSRLDEYIMGYVTPDKTDEWRKNGFYKDPKMKSAVDAVQKYLTRSNGLPTGHPLAASQPLQ